MRDAGAAVARFGTQPAATVDADPGAHRDGGHHHLVAPNYYRRSAGAAGVAAGKPRAAGSVVSLRPAKRSRLASTEEGCWDWADSRAAVKAAPGAEGPRPWGFPDAVCDRRAAPNLTGVARSARSYASAVHSEPVRVHSGPLVHSRRVRRPSVRSRLRPSRPAVSQREASQPARGAERRKAAARGPARPAEQVGRWGPAGKRPKDSGSSGSAVGLSR